MTRPRKRSFNIRGHRTSLSLEEPFWDALRDIADREKKSLSKLVADIDTTRDGGASGLSGAVRIFILQHYRKRAEDTSDP